MRKQSARVLKSEIGNRAIITGRWDYRLGNSRNCFNAHGFRGVTACGGLLLLRTRRSSGLPHFPFPANSPLVDSPRRKWLLRRSRVSVEATDRPRSASPGEAQARYRAALGIGRSRKSRLGV